MHEPRCHTMPQLWLLSSTELIIQASTTTYRTVPRLRAHEEGSDDEESFHKKQCRRQARDRRALQPILLGATTLGPTHHDAWTACHAPERWPSGVVFFFACWHSEELGCVSEALSVAHLLPCKIRAPCIAQQQPDSPKRSCLSA